MSESEHLNSIHVNWRSVLLACFDKSLLIAGEGSLFALISSENHSGSYWEQFRLSSFKDQNRLSSFPFLIIALSPPEMLAVLYCWLFSCAKKPILWNDLVQMLFLFHRNWYYWGAFWLHCETIHRLFNRLHAVGPSWIPLQWQRQIRIYLRLSFELTHLLFASSGLTTLGRSHHGCWETNSCSYARKPLERKTTPEA